jgi:hypothetical protein
LYTSFSVLSEAELTGMNLRVFASADLPHDLVVVLRSPLNLKVICEG